MRFGFARGLFDAPSSDLPCFNQRVGDHALLTTCRDRNADELWAGENLIIFGVSVSKSATMDPGRYESNRYRFHDLFFGRCSGRSLSLPQLTPISHGC
jgi:hypothetical protein